MCGIAGRFHPQSLPLDAEWRSRADERLAHRGPDGEGFYSDRFVGLGHRRLAIIDLSPAGHQPMVSRDQQVVLTYNGEIYNADPEKVGETDDQGFGYLVEYARSLMVDQYFGDKVPQLAEVVRKALEKNAAIGITTFSSHITGLRFIDAYMQLVRSKTMPIRLRSSITSTLRW